MPTAQELAHRGQQYRNYDPAEFIAAFDETDGDSAEVDRKIRGALDTIESKRLTPFLEATSSMFSRLDSDEKELFTRRNPDVVQWVSIYNTASDHNPYQEYYDLAGTMLTGKDRLMREDVTVPPFERPDRGDDSLLRSMRYRRRSYRNWAPAEFQTISFGVHELTEAEAVDLGMINPGTAEGVDWPVEFEGRDVARQLLKRVESGRFEPVVNNASRFFRPLDPDERRLFANRNPGLTVWISVWGRANHVIHYGQGMFPLSEIDWPTLGEVGHDWPEAP